MPKYALHVANVATGTAAKTHLQLVTPATRRAWPLRLVVSLAGVTASDVPGDVDLVIQTGAGTSSALTPTKMDAAETSAICTALQGFSGTEPTYGDYLYRGQLTPNGGYLDVPLDDLGIVVAAGTRLGLVLTFAATVVATSSLYYSE